MSNWDFSNPGAGSFGSLETSITTIGNAERSTQAVYDAAYAAKALVTWDAWSGDAGTSWRMTALGILNDLPGRKAVFDDAQAAIRNYRSEFDDIKGQADFERQKLADANAVLMHFSGISLNPIDNGVEMAKKAKALLEQTQAMAALVALGNRRQSADNALVTALSQATPASWADQKRAFAEVGITSTADLTPASIAAAMADLAARIGSAEGADQETLDAFDEFMDIYGDDPDVMSQFFQDLGGVDTLGLVDALGDKYGQTQDDRYLDLAQQVRHGLSIGSAAWDAPTAQAFSDEMFYHEGFTTVGETPGDRAWVDQFAAIAYLFSDSDNDIMGRELTIASANAVDDLERIQGQNLFGSAVNANEGGGALYQAENIGRYELLTGQQFDPFMSPGLQDSAGAVFETLGHYPDDALAFLADDSADKISYWYQERAWDEADGFEGPASLWYGAASSESGDPTTLAEVNARVMWAITQNETFLSEYLTPDAAADLGAAIGLNLDDFASYLGGDISSDDPADQRGPDGPGSFLYDIFGADGQQRPGAAVTIDIIAKLFGEVGATQDGAEAIALSAAVHEYAYFESAQGNDYAIGQALERSNILDGLINGSAVGATLGSAERADLYSDEVFERNTFLINKALGVIKGILPIPPGGDWLVDAGQDALEDHIRDSFHIYDAVSAEMTDLGDQQLFAAQMANGERLRDVLDLPVGPQPDPDDFANAADYISASDDWYQSIMADPHAAQFETQAALRIYELSTMAGESVTDG